MEGKFRDLTVEEINTDLRRNLPEHSVKLDDLINATYVPLPRTRESVIRNYSVASHVRDFIHDQEIRTSYSLGEVMPIVFTPIIGVSEINNIIGYGRSGGLCELSSIGLIEIKYAGPSTYRKKTILKTNDFETMKKGLVKYAAKRDSAKAKGLREKFDTEMVELKGYIDSISASTSSIFQGFAKWHSGRRGNPQKLLDDFMISKREEYAREIEKKAMV